MKTEHQVRIEKFMKMVGQEVPEELTIPPERVRKLRAKLILEEALETIKGLGFDENLNPTEKGCDIVEVADGCADLSVVTIGTLSAFGIKDKKLLEEVDRNNLTKGEGHMREDGKWIKPDHWTPPDILGNI